MTEQAVIIPQAEVESALPAKPLSFDESVLASTLQRRVKEGRGRFDTRQPLDILNRSYLDLFFEKNFRVVVDEKGVELKANNQFTSKVLTAIVRLRAGVIDMVAYGILAEFREELGLTEERLAAMSVDETTSCLQTLLPQIEGIEATAARALFRHRQSRRIFVGQIPDDDRQLLQLFTQHYLDQENYPADQFGQTIAQTIRESNNFATQVIQPTLERMGVAAAEQQTVTQQLETIWQQTGVFDLDARRQFVNGLFRSVNGSVTTGAVLAALETLADHPLSLQRVARRSTGLTKMEIRRRFEASHHYGRYLDKIFGETSNWTEMGNRGKLAEVMVDYYGTDFKETIRQLDHLFYEERDPSHAGSNRQLALLRVLSLFKIENPEKNTLLLVTTERPQPERRTKPQVDRLERTRRDFLRLAAGTAAAAGAVALGLKVGEAIVSNADQISSTIGDVLGQLSRGIQPLLPPVAEVDWEGLEEDVGQLGNQELSRLANAVYERIETENPHLLQPPKREAGADFVLSDKKPETISQTIGELLARPETLTLGFRGLYDFGIIDFPDCQQALLSEELTQRCQTAVATLVSLCRSRNISPTTPIGHLNPGNTIDGVPTRLITSPAEAVREMIIYVQGQDQPQAPSVLNLSFLPVSSQNRKGAYDYWGPQLRAARKRTAVLDTEIVLTSIEESAATFSLDQLAQLPPSYYGINIPQLRAWVEEQQRAFDPVDLAKFTSTAMRLHQEGQIDLNLITAKEDDYYVNLEQLIGRLEEIELEKVDRRLEKIAGAVGAVAGVISPKERRRESVKRLMAVKMFQNEREAAKKQELMGRRAFVAGLLGTGVAATGLGMVLGSQRFIEWFSGQPYRDVLQMVEQITPETWQMFEQRLPSISGSLMPASYVTTIKTADGKIIAQQYDQERDYSSLSQIPADLRRMLFTVEDTRFFEHNGADFIGLLRAVEANISGGREGASTLTQQLVRMLVFSQQELVSETTQQACQRKAVEILLALTLEERLTRQLGSKEAAKAAILEAYCSYVPLGPNIYGFQTAARRYFNRELHQLSTEQMVFLVGLAQDPVGYDPNLHFEAARQRQKVVLERLVAASILSNVEADRLFEAGITLQPYSQEFYHTSDFFYNVWGQLQQQLPADVIQSGLEVTTTLGSQLQTAVGRITTTYLETVRKPYEVDSCRVLIMDAHSGQVLAFWGDNMRDTRSPGSALKPFLCTQELMDSSLAPQGKVSDAPLSMQTHTGGVEAVSNFGRGGSGGRVSWQDALRRSWNRPHVREEMTTTGLPRFFHFLKHTLRLPIDLANLHWTTILGSSHVDMLSMARAYSPFYNGGRLLHPAIPEVRQVRTVSGRSVYQNQPIPQQVISPAVAALVVNALTRRFTVAGETREYSYKTGTSWGPCDFWAAGGIPGLVCVAWLGNQDRTAATERAATSEIAAPLFRQIIDYLQTEYLPSKVSPPPPSSQPSRQRWE